MSTALALASLKPITRHLRQIQALEDKTRFHFWLVGRRGGKTKGFQEDGLSSVPSCPPEGEIFFIGPTNQDAMDLYWNPLEERLDELKWKYKARRSEQAFELRNKRKIQIIGAEKIRRVRGRKLWRAYLDEIAFFSKSLFDVWRAVRPALSDLTGSAKFGTTPDGKQTEAYDFYLDILKKEDWSYHHWKTIDNPFIDPNEVAAARRELDERSFKQEYEATWESFEGLAYYCFEENEHISKVRINEINPALPLGLSLDFNVNPTTLLLDQKVERGLQVKREYSLKNSSTEATIKAFCEDYKHQKNELQLHLYGDATGNNRTSKTGRSDYYYIEQWLSTYGFNFQKKVPAANPPIIDRVAHVNAWLRNVEGESRILIDPSCSDLIRDLSSQALDGRFPSDKNNLGHKADALGYRVYWEQVIGGRAPQRTREI